MSKEKFLDFISNMSLNDKKTNEIISLYNKIGSEDVEMLEEYMDDCEMINDYDYNALKEFINGIITLRKEKEAKKAKVKDVSQSTNLFEIVKVIQELNPEAKIAVGDPDYDPMVNRRFYSSIPAEELVLPEGFYYNDKNGITNKHNTKSGAYCSIETEDIALANPRKTLTLDELEEYEEYDEDEEEEEEIPLVEERQPGKIRMFFKNLFSKKEKDKEYEYTYEFDDEIPMVEERQSSKIGMFFKNLKNKFTRKNKKVEEKESKNIEPAKKENNNVKTEMFNKNMQLINGYIEHCGFDDKEINDYINLIKFRDDKVEVTNNIVKYILSNPENTDKEEFLNVLADSLGIAKTNKPEPIKPEPIKPEPIKSEPIKSEPIKPVDKKEEIIEPELNEKYTSIKDELFNELGEYEKKFIEDMYSENLQPGDPEFDQMLAERTVNKAQIHKYLLSVEKIKMLNAYENLGEFEKMFIEDAIAECLEPNDPEFDQMMSERCVSKKSINKYIDIMKASRTYQEQIIKNYKKEIEFEKNIDLTSKKKDELVKLAKENDAKNISKMNKKQLIELLNQLNEMKLAQADKELGLTK